MSKFTFDDIVRVKANASPSLRPGTKAWIVMVFTEDERKGKYFDQFPAGTVYSIEYEDGQSAEVHESVIEWFSPQ